MKSVGIRPAISQRVVEVPAIQIPSFRYHFAKEDGVKKLMMTTAGGLGDQVTAEPTLRYAFKLFSEYEISLLTSFPDLFTHLPFKRVYKSGSPEVSGLIEEDYLTLHTYSKRQNMSDDFIAHHFTHAVDYSSLLAFQRQLPTSERAIVLEGSDFHLSCQSIKIVLHPGRHWASKTFPESWWNEVIERMGAAYPNQVAIIGKDVDSETGTVNVTVPPTVLDMRNQLDLKNLISLLKAARLVVTNDSAPLHIAAAGYAHILFIASAKHPDHITHWRQPQNHGSPMWGWRMQNMGRDGLWNHVSSNPVRTEPLEIDGMAPEIMAGLLPAPGEVVNRARMLV